jgi:ubiquinone/menaquinone biosynthesis C-methylase UbiE
MTIADLIPCEAKVVDVCCGDCYIYLNFLKKKNVKYLGLDINQAFVNAAKRKGISVELFDLRVSY